MLWRCPHNFAIYDAGRRKQPYVCSFHWFRAPGGYLVGIDVVHADNTGTRALRCFLVDPEGRMRAFVHEAPSERWAPFLCEGDARPSLERLAAKERNVVGRGPSWLVADVRAEGQATPRVRFSLELTPGTVSAGFGRAALFVAALSANDFLDVRTRGVLEFGDQRFEIDAVGPCSLHFGARLPSYAYVANVPAGGDISITRAIIVSIRGDNVRVPNPLPDDVAFTYALGQGALAKRSLRVGRPARALRFAWLRRAALVLAPVSAESRHDHALQGLPTVTATTTARVEFARRDPLALDRVIVDYRGTPYTRLLDDD